MTSIADAREAAGRYAEDMIVDEDPHGNLAEQLVSDEVFGTLAVARKEVEIQLTYDRGEIQDGTKRRMEQAEDRLESAMRARSGTVLNDD